MYPSKNLLKSYASVLWKH